MGPSSGILQNQEAPFRDVLVRIFHGILRHCICTAFRPGVIAVNFIYHIVFLIGTVRSFSLFVAHASSLVYLFDVFYLVQV